MFFVCEQARRAACACDSGCEVGILELFAVVYSALRSADYFYQAFGDFKRAVIESNIVVFGKVVSVYNVVAVFVGYNNACGIDSVYYGRGRVIDNGNSNHACNCALRGRKSSIAVCLFNRHFIARKRLVVVDLLGTARRDRDLTFVDDQFAACENYLVILGYVVVTVENLDFQSVVYVFPNVLNGRGIDNYRFLPFNDFGVAYYFKIGTIVRFTVVYELFRCGLHGYLAFCDRQRAILRVNIVVVPHIVAVCIGDRIYRDDVGAMSYDRYTALYGCIDNMSVNKSDVIVFVKVVDDIARVKERRAVVHSRLAVGGDGDRTRRDFECALLAFGIGYIIVVSDVGFAVVNSDFKFVGDFAVPNVLYRCVVDNSRDLSADYRTFSVRYAFAFRDFEFVPELVLSVVYESCRLAFYAYRALGDGKCAVGVFYLVILRYDVYVAVFTHDGYLDGDFILLATCIGKFCPRVCFDYVSVYQTDILAKMRVIEIIFID